MKKVFISMPMNGLSKEEIKQKRKDEEIFIKMMIEEEFEPIEILDSFFEEDEFEEDVKNKAIYYLAKSIELLADADLAYFTAGWQNARGCTVEHEVAVRYGIPIMYE